MTTEISVNYVEKDEVKFTQSICIQEHFKLYKILYMSYWLCFVLLI